MSLDEASRLMLHQAKEHYAAGELDKAEPLLSKLIAEGNAYPDVYNMLGVVMHGQSRFTQAQHAFEEALRLNPRYTEAALNLTVTYNDLGKYQQARDVYQQAIVPTKNEPRHLDPFAKGKLANMHAATADAYISCGLHIEAIDEYRRALQLCPTFVDIRAKLAGALRDSGHKEDALLEYHRIKEQQPAFLLARIHLGVTLLSLGRRDEARAELQSVLAEDPTNKSCRVYLDLLGA